MATEQTPDRNLHHRGRTRAARWIKLGLLVAVTIVALVAMIWGWLPKPVPIDVAVAHVGPLEITVEEDGRTRVRERYVVFAPISGNLERIALDAGATVTRGEVVARIAPPDSGLLDPRSRKQASAALDAAGARERTAAASVMRARAASDVATLDAARTRLLAERGAVAMTTRDHDDLAAYGDKQDLVAAEAQHRAALADVEAAQAALDASDPRGPTVVVTAPISGSVLRVVRDSAGPVVAGASLLELGDPTDLEVVVDVLSSDGARIVTGRPVAIAGWGGDHELVGSVLRVEPSAFTKVSALGVDEQRVNVIVAVASPPANLADGFRVEARILLSRGDALKVPTSAVFRDHGQWSVYVIDGGRARLQHVELGRRGRLELEIANGIAPGVEVVLHPSDRVVNGTRVQRAAADE